MNVLVCCKAIPKDPDRFTLSNDGRGIDHNAGSFILNESDEYALDQALLLKKTWGGTVTTATLGTLPSQEVLYLALAKGSDGAVRVDSPVSSPLEVATLLGKLARSKAADLVLVGVQSADRMASLVGGLLAGAAGWPFVFAATSIEAASQARQIIVERELGEGKLQKLEVDLPAVLAVQTGICPLTYAPPARRIKARQTRIEVVEAEDLGCPPDVLESCRTELVEEILTPSVSGTARILNGEPEEMARFIIKKIQGVGGER